MTEQAPQKHETGQESLAKLAEQELARPKAEAGHNEKKPALSAHEARKTVAEATAAEIQPNPLEQLQAAEKAPQPVVSHHNINRELKQITLRRELQQIRRKLPAPQRVLSRVIHQPVVRVISEGAGKTVSRPSGLLGGGLVALLGTSVYLYLAKHLGFEYNYAIWLLLFAGGFVLGLGLELLVHLATASRRKLDH